MDHEAIEVTHHIGELRRCLEDCRPEELSMNTVEVLDEAKCAALGLVLHIDTVLDRRDPIEEDRDLC